MIWFCNATHRLCYNNTWWLMISNDFWWLYLHDFFPYWLLQWPCDLSWSMRHYNVRSNPHTEKSVSIGDHLFCNPVTMIMANSAYWMTSDHFGRKVYDTELSSQLDSLASLASNRPTNWNKTQKKPQGRTPKNCPATPTLCEK
jgi:hypothetical protein